MGPLGDIASVARMAGVDRGVGGKGGGGGGGGGGGRGGVEGGKEDVDAAADSEEAQLQVVEARKDRRDRQEAARRVRPSLAVLFSVPLVYRDGGGRLHPMELLDYEVERELLWASMKEASRDIDLRFDFATTERLRNITTLGCRVIHYSGHGHPDYLSFEDGVGGLHMVNVETLAQLIMAGGPKGAKAKVQGRDGLQFVFVSACHSRRAGEAFIAAGVPHVVCIKVDSKLLDKAARVFTRAFYLSLVVGDSLADAFAIGRQSVNAAPHISNSSAEGDKFLLLPEGANHGVPVFPDVPIIHHWPPSPTNQAAAGGGEGGRGAGGGEGGGDGGAAAAMPLTRVVGGFTGACPSPSLPTMPEHYIGRSKDMYVWKISRGWGEGGGRGERKAGEEVGGELREIEGRGEERE